MRFCFSYCFLALIIVKKTRNVADFFVIKVNELARKANSF